MPTFGEKLKELREQAGLSQAELAEKAGTAQKTISFWEMDKREPSAGNVQKLCAALGISCEVLMQATFPDSPEPEKPKKKKKD